MQNIEIKSRLADPETMERKVLELGADFVWSRQQRDTFYRVSSGYLKLREAGGETAELIAYTRAPGSDPRPSHYEIAVVADPAGLARVLARSLGVRAVVNKTRRLFQWRHTRIHLDDVDGLGWFLELETVVTGISGAEAEAETRVLIAKLALDPREFLDRPYVELAEGGETETASGAGTVAPQEKGRGSPKSGF